jgi:hypothetical protein
MSYEFDPAATRRYLWNLRTFDEVKVDSKCLPWIPRKSDGENKMEFVNEIVMYELREWLKKLPLENLRLIYTRRHNNHHDGGDDVQDYNNRYMLIDKIATAYLGGQKANGLWKKYGHNKVGLVRYMREKGLVPRRGDMLVGMINEVFKKIGAE